MASDIDDNLGDWSDLVSIELFTALANGLNAMIDGVAVGEIATIMVVPGLTPPLDPTIWQLCVGGTVTEQLSPIRGQTVPDMRDRYMKGATNLSTVGLLGGSNSYNFYHNHGGATGIQSDPLQVIADDSDGYWSAVDHVHGIYGDMGVMDMQPSHYRLEHYLKIR